MRPRPRPRKTELRVDAVCARHGGFNEAAAAAAENRRGPTRTSTAGPSFNEAAAAAAENLWRADAHGPRLRTLQ